jgi:succinate-semialdehyde dehydrogenase/glutarate-semialdehyde dehydrogenase
MSIESINPADGTLLTTFEETPPDEVSRILDGARAAFAAWSRRPVAERAAMVVRAADWLEAHVEELARLITVEMGKTIVESRAEVRKCAWNCRWFAEHGPAFLAPEPAPSSARESFVEFPPLGVVLAIMPWNFPLWQVFRFAAPALLAGDVAVLKHASNVPQCALAIERAFRESGFPEGVFRTLLVGGARAEELIDDPRIAAVTLTGSEAVGARVARRAGAALKKAVLELGGSDPYLVLGDADAMAAASLAVRARFQNAGQSCIAAKRFIVEKRAAVEFIEAFVRGARALRVGDPLREETQMGPLARADLRGALADQVARSLGAGAKLVCGGRAVDGPGFFYEPTVLAEVRPGMPAFDEETFGPVAAVTLADDEEHALALANATPYGLGANLWTRDLERAKRLAPRIEAGSVFINGMVASDPRLPFGGVKRSGYGRELSHYGIREFVNIQTVWIGPAQSEQPRAE